MKAKPSYYELEEENRRIKSDLNRAQTLVEMAGDPIISLDERGRISFFNATAEGLFGYFKDEVMGKELDILIPSRYIERYRRQMRNNLDSIDFSSMSMKHSVLCRKKDGTEFHAEVSISASELSESMDIHCIVRDV